MAIITVNGVRQDVPTGSLVSSIIHPPHALEMPCAGRGQCGKCRVVAHGALSSPSAEERIHLTEQELENGVRLACCCSIEGDCAISLTENAASQILLTGKLPAFERNPGFTSYGIAMDLGTTTIAGCLYDAEGTLIAQSSAPNPQIQWGADVISRIEAALMGHAVSLSASIRNEISKMILQLSAKALISPDQIEKIVLTGNTVMLFLLTQTDSECLSHAPFTASRLFGENIPAAELDLPCPDADVFLPRCISAFIGADITTALLASSIYKGKGTHALMDIGTNGEIALWHNGKLFCCSTAAGPAFEGVGLHMGMTGKAGAIDRVYRNGDTLEGHVIGCVSPRGICGSGVVDAIASLLEMGLLSSSGVLKYDPTEIMPPVCITQNDIRMIQMAKSAICSGLLTLFKVGGVSSHDIAQVSIAGGFGSYLDVANAGRIGLFPEELIDKVHILGNAALSGAIMLLLNQDLVSEAQTVAENAVTIDLSSNSVFFNLYTENMFFDSENE